MNILELIAIGRFLLRLGLWIVALAFIGILFQDIFLYVKYHDKSATLIGDFAKWLKVTVRKWNKNFFKGGSNA